MGNRGKGGSKGKGRKKGGGGNGKGKRRGAQQWGDEDRALTDRDETLVKKRPRETQESQDRKRRVKIIELARAKERHRVARFSAPNCEVTVQEPKCKVKKRRRTKRTSRKVGTGPSAFSSSDEDSDGARGVGEDGGSARRRQDVVGLTGYKKLLLALQGSTRVSGVGRAMGDEDIDVTAAIAIRRLQEEGNDILENSSSEEEMEEVVDEEGQESEESDENSENMNSEKTGERDREEEKKDDRVVEAEDEAVSDIEGDGDALADGAGENLGVRPDEFSRHFISTPAFSAEEAEHMLSPSGRPSFDNLSSAATLQRQWAAEGLTAAASTKTGSNGCNRVMVDQLNIGASLSQDLGILPSLADCWEESNGGPTSHLQSLLLPQFMGYRDVLFCGWRDEDGSSIRRAYALHALNHALTSQRRVLRHTRRLHRDAETAKVEKVLAGQESKTKTDNGLREEKGSKGGEVGCARDNKKKGSSASAEPAGPAAEESRGPATSIGVDAEAETTEWHRDQGFTRGKVLLLLPFRGLAFEVVEAMVALLGPKTSVANWDRFREEYGPDGGPDREGEGTVDEDEGRVSKKSGAGGVSTGKRDLDREDRIRAVLAQKPDDWKALLGGGRNVDD
ncbi:unnamed protein product, partial [Choristocarpus tenellus]